MTRWFFVALVVSRIGVFSMVFREVPQAKDATFLYDGVHLGNGVVLPWVGYGTYRLGKNNAFCSTLEALRVGYRCIDTAFVYGRETTEQLVGEAIREAIRQGVVASRKDVFVITKQWRDYHGFEPTQTCLKRSLERLDGCIDLWLMHWPGPPSSSSSSNNEMTNMVSVRAETWRAMEDALQRGRVRAIGVSNFTVRHLEHLKKTATVWPPAVNQVECHPLYQQHELREYCRREGIVLQAYAALGGQDTTRAKRKELFGTSHTKLVDCETVTRVARAVGVSNARVLLRYALQRNCAVTPKTTSVARMEDNANVFGFQLTHEHMQALDALQAPGDTGRLCWRTDPLRLLDFD